MKMNIRDKAKQKVIFYGLLYLGVVILDYALNKIEERHELNSSGDDDTKKVKTKEPIKKSNSKIKREVSVTHH